MKGFDGLIVRVAAACRSFHTFSSSFSAAAPLNKSSLSTLRKRTGYTFANCKRALEQFGDDLQKAEAWLRDQAQKEGWAKATKLQDRVAVQGLVGVKYKPEDGIGVLVEVNCETDFVARNAKFQELVSTIAECCAREVDLKPIDGASYHKVLSPFCRSNFSPTRKSWRKAAQGCRMFKLKSPAQGKGLWHWYRCRKLGVTV